MTGRYDDGRPERRRPSERCCKRRWEIAREQWIVFLHGKLNHQQRDRWLGSDDEVDRIINRKDIAELPSVAVVRFCNFTSVVTIRIDNVKMCVRINLA